MRNHTRVNLITFDTSWAPTSYECNTLIMFVIWNKDISASASEMVSKMNIQLRSGDVASSKTLSFADVEVRVS